MCVCISSVTLEDILEVSIKLEKDEEEILPN